ncbi:MAG: M56 family metallopeptidase [Kofleriaceae bacterium]|nr:M56 family metallopeptidase [Kofleriaceae bacterium]
MTFVVSAGAFAKAWLATIGMMAATGTLLAIAALVLSRVGRLRPAWQAALWLVVTAKLALPWGPAMPWSISDLIAGLSSHQHEAVVTIVHPGTVGPAAIPQAWPAVGWLALMLVWAAGAAFVVTRAIFVQRATSRAARIAPPASAAAHALLVELAARVSVRVPRLVIGDPDTGPHVVGLVRPTIVVPAALAADLALLRAALLHELAHIRRRDALARILQITASALMWWMPVARLVNRRLEAAREAACDAWALEAGDVPRAAYARLLVRMASLRTVAAPAGAALAAHNHGLDARVTAILGSAARPRLGLPHRIALAGWIVLALGGARTAHAKPHAEVCRYTPEFAEALYSAYPQADLDGDGVLSREEACDLQAELRREIEVSSSRSPEAEAQLSSLLSEPLCCNCDGPEFYSSPETATCQKTEGVEP